MVSSWFQQRVGAIVLCAGFALGVVFSLTCCGSGGGGDAVAAGEGSRARVHVIRFANPVTVPAGTATDVVSETFTPADPNATLLYATARGNYQATIAGGVMTLSLTGGGATPSLSTNLPLQDAAGEIFHAVAQNQNQSSFTFIGDLPAASYAVRLRVAAPQTSDVTLTGITIKIFTIEDVEVLDPSPAF